MLIIFFPQLWDLSAGRLLTEFKGHKGSVISTRFHPKEFLLASGSSDRTAKIWDLESFQLLAEPSPEANTVGSVLFHPEGTALFSGSQDSLKVGRQARREREKGREKDKSKLISRGSLHISQICHLLYTVYPSL